jgi:hypothetical protein
MAQEYPRTKEDREYLIRFNEKKAIECYAGALADGMEDPVVLILDTHDCLGMWLAAAAHPDGLKGARAEAKKVEEQHPGEKVIPTSFVIADRLPALKMLRVGQQFLRKVDSRNVGVSQAVEDLQHPAPEGYFWAMVVSGGKLLVGMPKPEFNVAIKLGGATEPVQPKPLPTGTVFLSDGQNRFRGTFDRSKANWN